MITRHVYCYFIQDIIFSEVPFSVVQLLHHTGIVERQSDSQLTKALEKKVNSLDKFVKPAQPCRRISDTIGCLNRGSPSAITTPTVYARCWDYQRNADPSPDELSEGRHTALRWTRQNYDHKLTTDTISEFGSAIRRIIHVNRGVTSGRGFHPALWHGYTERWVHMLDSNGRRRRVISCTGGRECKFPAATQPFDPKSG